MTIFYKINKWCLNDWNWTASTDTKITSIAYWEHIEPENTMAYFDINTFRGPVIIKEVALIPFMVDEVQSQCEQTSIKLWNTSIEVVINIQTVCTEDLYNILIFYSQIINITLRHNNLYHLINIYTKLVFL